MNATKKLITSIQSEAGSFTDPFWFDRIIEADGKAKFVLLGEASHGTSEFYTIRAKISKELIERKGFNRCGRGLAFLLYS
ncbi:hypothetical protein M3205_23760 [Cytobacillus firmus]|uniref:hypothetical protein n=1 Tax=Cytobacillus sp. FSL R5-0596 TaxID=2954696 RepID=UPI0020416C65|nr:hypothetical protein [Cytobacillus firmus]MCM3708663.1 hypothetical protein [Cytobacillus firmus]